jgi:hypothetical protein
VRTINILSALAVGSLASRGYEPADGLIRILFGGMIILASIAGTSASYAATYALDGCVNVEHSVAYTSLALRPVAGVDDLRQPGTLATKLFYTTAARLMPAWGLYPNYGAFPTPSIDGFAADGRGKLTWVVDFPDKAQTVYHVWVRHLNAGGSTTITIDDQPIGTRSGPGGGVYVWDKVGTYAATPGQHYVDIIVGPRVLFDALVFSTDSAFNPEPMPRPETLVENPVTQSQRAYRLLAAAQEHKAPPLWAVGHATRQYDEDVDDWTLSTAGTADLILWGAASQYVSGAFVLAAGAAGADVTVTLNALTSPQHDVIRRPQIDIRVAKSVPLNSQLFDNPAGHKRNIAKILLKSDDPDPNAAAPFDLESQGTFGGGVSSSRLPAFNSRLFWMTVHVPPGTRPGVYQGTLTITDTRAACLTQRVPVTLEVLSIDLQSIDGIEGIFYRASPATDRYPLDGEVEKFITIPRNQYIFELQDLAAHGLNAVTSYGWNQAAPGSWLAPWIGRAGLTKALLDIKLLIETYGGAVAEEATALVRRHGIAELIDWCIDEPNIDDVHTGANQAKMIDTCLDERQGKLKTAITFTAWSRTAFERYKDRVERPIMNIYWYNIHDKGDTDYVRSKGHTPLSYFSNPSTYPIYDRLRVGFHNRAKGWDGQFPWAYRDHEAHDGLDLLQQEIRAGGGMSIMTYPDQQGRPITTRQWEAYREGLDDVRYLQALTRAIAAGKNHIANGSASDALRAVVKEAENWKTENFDRYGETVIWDLVKFTDEVEFDTFRRGCADFTMVIQQHL